MEPVHRRVLQKLRLYLCEELLVSEGVLSFLYQEEVVTAAQANDVLAESSERKRCLKLLDLLPQRGPGAFAAFLGALDDFAWVRQRLLREEQTLRNVRSPSPESPTSADAGMTSTLCTAVFFNHSGVEIPSDRQLSRLASALGAEWESVATDLGVSPAALFRCRADHALCCRDAALAALLLWRRSQGKKATARRLRQSLRAAGVHPSVLDDVATP
nr:death domain-containing protein CRADD-like [Nerophis lumbriciformis]